MIMNSKVSYFIFACTTQIQCMFNVYTCTCTYDIRKLLEISSSTARASKILLKINNSKIYYSHKL